MGGKKPQTKRVALETEKWQNCCQVLNPAEGTDEDMGRTCGGTEATSPRHS